MSDTNMVDFRNKLNTAMGNMDLNCEFGTSYIFMKKGSVVDKHTPFVKVAAR